MSDDGPTSITVTVPSSSMEGSKSGLIHTPAGQPNIVLKVLEPFTIIVVRVMRVYLQTLLGLVTAGLAAPKAIPVADFAHLVILSASLSVAPAAICAIQNGIELLAQFDQKHPTLTA